LSDVKTSQLALHGGTPVRKRLLPYGHHDIDDDDVAAVVAVLRSDWLTGGPLVGEFERAVARVADAEDAVAVNSGTAGLHAAMFALGVGPGDEVIVPPMTFAASASAVIYQGGTPVFADVEPDTLLLDPSCVEAAITPRTKAIVAVDYAGQLCDYDALRGVARGLPIVADSCHAIGAEDRGRRIGALADLAVFSFHPVKHVTTGEGGAVAVSQPELAARMRGFRNHGITVDHRQRSAQGSWKYEIAELGFNYRLSDIQCALGAAELVKLPARLARRQAIAGEYTRAFAGVPEVRGVWSHAAGGSRLWLTVAIKQMYAGHAKQAGLIASQCHAGAYVNRFVVVVDEDIDPADMDKVIWAMCTRCDPREGMEILRGCWSSALDPMAYSETDPRNARVVIDACKPFVRRDTFPIVVRASQEVEDLVRGKFGDKLPK